MVTTVDFRDELFNQARLLAVKEKITMKRIMNEALQAYLKAQEKRKKE